MNARQAAFYLQAQSDWSVFKHFQAHVPPFAPCHELHYLQICTEKLAKAYYPSALSGSGHAAFRRFLKDLPNNRGAEAPLGFADTASLTRWQGSVSVIVGAIEDLAPSIADKKNLPNPEYPWPRRAEVSAPANYLFQAEVFDLLDRQSKSGEPRFLTILGRMVDTMRGICDRIIGVSRERSLL